MPKRQDDNYQYDAGTTNDAALNRYRLYDKGDEGHLEIIDKQTGRAVFVKDGGLDSDRSNGIYWAREEDGDDIFDATNKALTEAGSDATVFVVPGRYNKSNGNPVSTQLKSQAEGQRVNFLGADVQLADGADVDPIHITHDSFNLENLLISANRPNNTNTRALHVDNVRDFSGENIEFASADIAVEFTNTRNSGFTSANSQSDVADVGTSILAVSCSNSSFINSNITGFENYGVELRNCEDMVLSSLVITTNPSGQTVAEAGLLVKGTVQSRIDTTVESQGDVKRGVYTKPFDIGGTNETKSDHNRYEVKVEGARDIGIHLEDAGSETVNGLIDGEYDTGRTTKALSVDFPNNIDQSPGHLLDINTQKCVRVTDSTVDTNNAGIRMIGHHQQMQEVSNITLNGTSVFNPSFGPAMPKPSFNIGVDTTVEAEVRAKRTTTDSNGQVSLSWSDLYAFDERPILSVQLETSGQWYISSFTTDANGRYTGATIQVTDSSGTAVGTGVNVIAVLQGT